MASKATNVLREQAGSLGVSARPGVTGTSEIEVCQESVVEGVRRGRTGRRSANARRYVAIPRVAGSCIVCGESFIGSRGRRFCGPKCGERHRPKRTFERTCEQCGNEFDAASRNTRFCSMACVGAYNVVDRSTMCQQCGTVFQARDTAQTTFCCRVCADTHNVEQVLYRRAFASYFVQVGRLYTCRICGRVSEHSDTWKVACSLECRLALGRQRFGEAWLSVRETNAYESIECEECGETFGANAMVTRRRFCSDRCGGRHHKKRRRARLRGRYREHVSIQYLIDRDGGKCQSCGCKVVREPRLPKSATLDHIVPVAAGGEHSKANTQLLCLMCNSKKGASCGGQMLLIG